MAIKHTSWPIEVAKEKVKLKPEEEKKIEPFVKEENATRPKKKQQKRIILTEDD